MKEYLHPLLVLRILKAPPFANPFLTLKGWQEVKWILCTEGICRPIYRPTCRSTLDRYIDRHSADISIDTRPICRSSLRQYVGWYRSPLDRHTCRPILDRYAIDARPIPYRHSADTLPTLDRFHCSRLRCPLVCVPHIYRAGDRYCSFASPVG